MLGKILCLVSCFCCSQSANYSEDASLLSCLVKGLDKNFVNFKPILVSLPVDSRSRVHGSEILIGLRLWKKWPIILANINREALEAFKDHRTDKHENYLLYFNGSQEALKGFQALDAMLLLNPHARFLIVLHADVQPEDWAGGKIIHLLYQYYIFNAVIYIGKNLYKPQPFFEKSCKFNAEARLKLVDTCKSGKWLKDVHWYGESVPNKFESCDLKISYIEGPPHVINMENVSILDKNEFLHHGFEIGILANIFAHMNATLRFTKSEIIGDMYLNGTGTGSFLHLLRKDVDIVVGDYGATAPRMTFFDCSVPYSADGLVWVAPHYLVYSTGFISIVKTGVWVLIGLFIFMVSSIITVLGKYAENEHALYKQPFLVFSNVLTVVCNLPVATLPRNHRIRIFYPMILLLGFVFSTCYMTYHMSLIARDGLRKDKFKSPLDIANYKLKVYIVPNTKRFFQDKSSTVESFLVENAQICALKDFDTCLREIALLRSAALVASRPYIEYVQDNYIVEADYPPFVFFETGIKGSIFFYMAKGFWGVDRLNGLLYKAFEAGLIDKWTNIAISSKYMGRTDKSKLSFSGKPLNLRSCAQFCYGLLLAYLIATVVFIGELVVYRKTHSF
ncbi:uncharacterized protein LOC125505074 [Dendroctonus ponderosae]|uniref:uncharacterized protein LOC125505074 n=1 Tax=Dendroctonus ponderosae TaxID=77166 RepID=UPI00203531F2|nr:uncharacterized protein LOC125505074 [Dendroctonus ponderosae]